MTPPDDVSERLSEIRERVEAATEGPWRKYHGGYADCAATVVDDAGREDACGCEKEFGGTKTDQTP